MPLKTVSRTSGGGGGSGTVTDVNVSGGTTGLTTSGGPITTSGTITLGGVLDIDNGGTGNTLASAAFDALAPSTAKGDLIVYDGVDNVRLAVGTNGLYLKADSTTATGLKWDSVSGGGTVTSVTATSPLSSSGGATPDISLTGIIPINKGGTGETTSTNAFDALSPTTTKGDLIVNNGTDNIRLSVGTHGYVLSADSAAAAGVSWQSVSGGGGTTTFAATFDNSGTGAASGTTFNGSAARTISYNTIGAPKTDGTNATGTWGINISGNAATATSATSATTATSVSNAVTFTNTGGAVAGTTFNGSVARVIDYSTLGAPKADGTGASGTWGINISGNAATATSATSATSATTATNLASGAANQIPYQTASSTTSFLSAPVTANTFLKWNGTSIAWASIAEMTYPGSGIPNSTGTAWGTSYSTTGSGTVVALATSPSFTTPTLGVASATSINKVAITAPATSATLTIADGKTATINNTLTLSGTDATTMTFPSASTTVAGLGIAQTFTQDQTISGNLTLNAQGDVRFADADSSNWVAFQGPATVTSNVTWTLPSADGTSGQVLSTNGTGTLSWSSVSGSPGGSNTQIQFNNSGAFGGSANLTWDGTNVQLGATGALRFADTDSSNYVAFKSPGVVAANVTWTLPSTDGSSGQFLSTNGTGTLSWATASGGGGSATILENLQTISSNYTVSSGYNGISAGPVTVNTGVAVTVGTGQRWLILE